MYRIVSDKWYTCVLWDSRSLYLEYQTHFDFKKNENGGEDEDYLS